MLSVMRGYLRSGLENFQQVRNKMFVGVFDEGGFGVVR